MAAGIDHLIAKLRDDFSVSSIVVTHDVGHLFAYADRALMLYEGRAIQCDTPEALRQSKDPVVHQFIAGSMSGPIQV